MNNKKILKNNQSPTGTVYSEAETRRRLINNAKFWGCEHDLVAILNKYDKAMVKATTESQRKQIAEMGAAEVHKLFGMYGSLVVGGEEIIKEKK